MGFYQIYKERFHFSVNFFSVFLLIGFIPDIIGIDSSLIKYTFWILKAGLATLIIFKYHKKLYTLTWQEKLFLFVSVLYFINIFIDVFWHYDQFGLGNPIDLLGFFVSILIAFSFRYDPVFAEKRSFQFFLITLSLGLVIAYLMAKPSPLPLVGRYFANALVNSINYGQIGCALSVIALYGFFNKPSKYSKIIYPCLFLLGLISIIKAGSRSPVVILLVVSIFYFFAKSGLVKGLLLIGLSGLLLYFSIGFLVELSEALDSGIVSRLISAIESGETSGRDKIYSNAISQFAESPIFGSFYLIESGPGKGGYPHNFFLEAFMTTGIIGGIPFLMMVIVTLIKSFKLIKYKHPAGWIVLLFVQMLVYGLFSSSLYSSQDFWALCFFILSMNISLRTDFQYPMIEINDHLTKPLD